MNLDVIDHGMDFDVISCTDEKVVLRVRHLWPEDPVECCMCGRPTFSHLCVPYYCGPVAEGQSQGGYAVACGPCYGRWERWHDGMVEYASWFTNGDRHG